MPKLPERTPALPTQISKPPPPDNLSKKIEKVLKDLEKAHIMSEVMKRTGHSCIAVIFLAFVGILWTLLNFIGGRSLASDLLAVTVYFLI